MDDALLGFDIDAAMDSRQQQQKKQTQTQTQQQPGQSPSVGLPAAAPAAVVMMTAMQVTAPTFVAIPAANAAQQQQQQQQHHQYISVYLVTLRRYLINSALLGVRQLFISGRHTG